MDYSLSSRTPPKPLPPRGTYGVKQRTSSSPNGNMRVPADSSQNVRDMAGDLPPYSLGKYSASPEPQIHRTINPLNLNSKTSGSTYFAEQNLMTPYSQQTDTGLSFRSVPRSLPNPSPSAKMSPGSGQRPARSPLRSSNRGKALREGSGSPTTAKQRESAAMGLISLHQQRAAHLEEELEELVDVRDKLKTDFEPIMKMQHEIREKKESMANLMKVNTREGEEFEIEAAALQKENNNFEVRIAEAQNTGKEAVHEMENQCHNMRDRRQKAERELKQFDHRRERETAAWSSKFASFEEQLDRDAQNLRDAYRPEIDGLELEISLIKRETQRIQSSTQEKEEEYLCATQYIF